MTPRFCGSFKIGGTRSFRLASSKFFDYGNNCQNLHEAVADCLIARDGMLLMQCDQKAAESVVVANLAAPGNYLYMIEHGVKPHCVMALKIFGKFRRDWFLGLDEAFFLSDWSIPDLVNHPDWPVLDERIKKSKMEYTTGKRVIHASSYRMGPRTFQLSTIKDTAGKLFLTYKQCVDYLAVFNELLVEIPVWQTQVVNEAKTTGYLQNCMGYPRHFNQNWTHGYENEAISWIPQSTVGCLTHSAILNWLIYADTNNKKTWKLLSNIHDSYLVEIPLEDRDECTKAMVESYDIPLYGRTEFRIMGEVKSGTVYSQQK
jgi:hypothetical protein